jgi:hypothetical protein
MFEEIPPPPEPMSSRTTIAVFGAFFAIFLAGLVIDWFVWSGPMSLNRKVITGENVVGVFLAGAFLLTAKSTTPENNRKRILAVFLVTMLFQLFIDVHQ